jgi:hypothetical protein
MLGFINVSDVPCDDNQKYLSLPTFPSFDLYPSKVRAGKRTVVPYHYLPKILPEVEPVVTVQSPEQMVNELLQEPKGSFLRHYKQTLDRLEI